MPTAAVTTYSGFGLKPLYDTEDALVYHVKLPNSATYVKGTVLGELTATPGSFKAYASGNSDGSQTPKAILQHDVTVDSVGNHTIGTGEYGETFPSAPAFFSGTFKTSELTGLDATALTNKPAWNLINGSVTDGALRIG